MYNLAVLVFPGFEPLDAIGPLTFFSQREDVNVMVVAEQVGAVLSAKNGYLKWVPDKTFDQVISEDLPVDWLLVPGGVGTRQQVQNPRMLEFIRTYGTKAKLCMSVCTGAGLLAATGLLDGRRATSNKRAWAWVSTQGNGVQWVPKARWVQDGTFITAAGVAAGMDMAWDVARMVFGAEVAAEMADYAEYEPHTQADWDPFAAKNNLLA